MVRSFMSILDIVMYSVRKSNFFLTFILLLSLSGSAFALGGMTKDEALTPLSPKCPDTKIINPEIKRPKNPTEFLKNLKYWFDNDLYVKREIYTCQNLTRIFDAEYFQDVTDTPAYKYMNLYVLHAIDTVPAAWPDSPFGMERFELGPDGKPLEGGQEYSIIETFIGQSPPISVELVRSVFGPETELTPFHLFTEDGPATHPLGYHTLIYLYKTPLSRLVRINFQLNADGTLYLITSSQGR